MFTGADQLAVLDATARPILFAPARSPPSSWSRPRSIGSMRSTRLLNAVISTTYDEALARAAARPTGRFAGVPYLLKDLVVERAGTPFTEGSRSLAGNVSSVTSELATRLERAGLIILGRTNTPEFGMAPACEPLLYGPTRNPWSTDHSTSGSSGGSAAAVASGMVPMAHGNDVGGSIRYPASACGLFGLKPTRARVPLGPLYGDVANGMAVEHALTRTVRDSALLLDLTEGPGNRRPIPGTSTGPPAGRGDRRRPSSAPDRGQHPPGGRRGAAPGVRGCRRPGRRPAHRPRPRGDRGGPARSHRQRSDTRSAPSSTR